MSKHSPGPWKWHPSVTNEPRSQSSLHDVNDKYVACPNTDEEITVTDENARLIAAAPEMLELLRVAEEVRECISCDWGGEDCHESGCALKKLLKRIDEGTP